MSQCEARSLDNRFCLPITPRPTHGRTWDSRQCVAVDTIASAVRLSIATSSGSQVVSKYSRVSCLRSHRTPPSRDHTPCTTTTTNPQCHGQSTAKTQDAARSSFRAETFDCPARVGTSARFCSNRSWPRTIMPQTLLSLRVKQRSDFRSSVSKRSNSTNAGAW